jgi:hypothetical protein
MIQVFSKDWFALHQKKLLWFANTSVGRYVLRVHGKRSSVGKNKIVKILPNAITWSLSEKEGVLTTEFRTHDKFGKRLYYTFKPFWYLMHFFDWVLLDRFVWANKYSFGFATLGPVYPSAGEVAPVDGFALRTGDETFSTIRGGAGNDWSSTVGAANRFVALVASATSNQYSQLRRGIFLFDTSPLTASAIISAATASWAGSGQASGLGTDTLEVVSSAPGSDSALAAADYTTLGTTSFASLAYASYNSAGYNDLALNASGLANISKTANSKFGLSLGWDRANSFGGAWSSGLQTQFSGDYADTAGTTTDPKLVVTYTIAVPKGGTATMLGI